MWTIKKQARKEKKHMKHINIEEVIKEMNLTIIA